jgi:hypothetical protein
VVRARFKPVPPDERIRQLRKELKALQKEEPSPERAERLAAFARAAHEERQLNMAMHTAQLCLDEDPDDPALLLAAYEPGEDADPEEVIRGWADLQDLARYVDRADVKETADARVREAAIAWLRDADDAERRHRSRTLTSLFDRAFADDMLDEAR